MIDKRVASAEAVLADVRDGATLMIGGFGAISRVFLQLGLWVSAALLGSWISDQARWP